MDQNAASEANSGEPSVRIPDHELLRLIGRGSYGEIWLARNVMGVYRAVKVVYRSSFKDHRPFERELSGIRKYEPISRSHEKFIDILQIGINKEQDYFYYIMELGDDHASGQVIDPQNYSAKTLAKVLNNGAKLSLRECLELGLALAQALAELHKHGLVHRDIKPSNIIFVNGVAKLADIGLVADVSEARSYVGTEGYIPPDGPGTPFADVFSLGKVLYEASTGKDRMEFPDLPTFSGELDHHELFIELNEVILRACHQDAAKRYPTAWEMYSDLLVMADGKSVRRLRFLERRFSQLKRATAIAAGAVVVGTAIAYHLHRESVNAREARQRQAGANVAYGIRAIEASDLAGSLPHLVNALELDRGNADRERADRFMFGNALARCPKLTEMRVDKGGVETVQFSPGGDQLLVVQGRVRILDLGSEGQATPGFPSAASASQAAYSGDGKFVVTASGREAVVWRLSDGTNLTLPHPTNVYCAVFSPDGTRIVTGSADGRARIWNAQTAALICDRLGHRTNEPVMCAAYSPSGSQILTGCTDRTAQLWSAEGEPIGKTMRCGDWVTGASFSPDGQQAVLASHDHNAYVWGLSNGQYLRQTLPHPANVSDARFSPDGRFIVTACLDHTARLWSGETYKPSYPNAVLRHADRVIRASFSPDSRHIATGCTDGTIRVWDLASAEIMPQLVARRYSADGSRFVSLTNGTAQVADSRSGRQIANLDPCSQIANFSANGRFLVDCTTNSSKEGITRAFRVWDCESSGTVSSPVIVTNPVRGATVSPSGSRLMIFGGKQAEVWDVPAGSGPSRTLPHERAISSAFFNRSGTRVVTLSGNSAHVWDALTGKELFSPLTHPVPVRHAEFSPDESLLVTCGQDDYLTPCYAQVWDATTGRPTIPPLMHGDGILGAAFSPDGGRLITACEDYTAMIWSVKDGRRLCPALQHENQVDCARFSPDGKWVVTASADQTARVWNATTGDPLTPPLRHFGVVTSAFFLPDNEGLVTATLDRKTWVWNLHTDTRPLNELVALARLLSGGSTETPGVSAEPATRLWTRLRKSSSADFQSTEDECAAWEEFAAWDSESLGQWLAALSHWQRRLALRPGDQNAAQHLERVQARLKN